MDITRKVEIIKAGVESLARHDDMDAAVREAALDRVVAIVELERQAARDRVQAKIEAALGAAAEPQA